MKYKLLLLLLISAVILTFKLGSWGILETSEARYAEISKEMLDNGDFIHPRLLDIQHYHKPPMTYLITVGGYKLFGVNEFGARFFLQAALLIQLLLIYQITLILFKNKTTALIALLIYFSLPLVLISSRNLTTDAYLTTFVLGALWAWLVYKSTPNKPIFLYLFYLLLALGFETKGPVVLIFPLLFILSYKWVMKDSFTKSKHHIFGLILFIVVSSFWYLVLYFENPQILDYFVNNQVMDRISSKSYNRAKPFWFYFVTIPLLALPWSFIIILYYVKRPRHNTKQQRIDVVLWVSIIAIMCLFSLFKTKLILYVLPMFGFIAVLSAHILRTSSNQLRQWYDKLVLGVIILFMLSLIVVTVFDTSVHLNTAVTVGLVVLAILSIVLIKRYVSLSLKTACLGYVFGALLVLSGDYILNINESELNSAKVAIQYIDDELKDIDNIAMYNYLVTSTKYYSDKSVFTLNNGHNTVQRELQFEDDEHWKNKLIDIRTSYGKMEADSLMHHRTAILARKRDKLPPYLLNAFEQSVHKKEFGKWIIYY